MNERIRFPIDLSDEHSIVEGVAIAVSPAVSSEDNDYFIIRLDRKYRSKISCRSYTYCQVEHCDYIGDEK